MPFRFLLYLQPVRFFSIPRLDGTFIYPTFESIPKEILQDLYPNPSFTSARAKEYDLVWQAVHNGYTDGRVFYTSFVELPVRDEYIFLRSYFNPIWSVYVLLLRLFSLKNPIVEVIGFLNSRTIKKTRLKPLINKHPNNQKSLLVSKNPLVSVIIPTLNRYPYLKDVLEDLEKQDYQNFEVIVVDQSDDFSEDFYNAFNLNLKLIKQDEKALWLARNTAIENSKGEYLLFFDDDSRVNKDWILKHLKCMDYFSAAASSGVSLSAKDDSVPEHYSFYRIADQLDTGNVLLKKEVFRKIGLFDRQFEKQRMGDGEFGMRMYKNGFKNISNPEAARTHLKVGTGGLRHMGSWDAFRTKKLFAPRPIPSVLYFYRRYFGKRRAIYALLKSVPPSIIPYRFKRNKVLLLLGIFVSVCLLPLIAIQVGISWHQATKKINEGPLIRALD